MKNSDVFASCITGEIYRIHISCDKGMGRFSSLLISVNFCVNSFNFSMFKHGIMNKNLNKIIITRIVHIKVKFSASRKLEWGNFDIQWLLLFFFFFPVHITNVLY